MFRVHGNDIYISRGEAATLDISPVYDDGTYYDMQSGDVLTLTVYQPRGGRAVLTKDSADGSFAITGADTANLAGFYDYAVTLRYADGMQAEIIGRTPNYTPHFIVLTGGKE